MYAKVVLLQDCGVGSSYTRAFELVEQKYTVFKKQCAAVDSDVRMLRRAIRMIETNPSIVGLESPEDSDELHELRRSLANKEETYLELTAVSGSRDAQLAAANAGTFGVYCICIWLNLLCMVFGL